MRGDKVVMRGGHQRVYILVLDCQGGAPRVYIIIRLLRGVTKGYILVLGGTGGSPLVPAKGLVMER